MTHLKNNLNELEVGVQNEIVVLLLDIENCFAKDGGNYQRLRIRDTHGNTLIITAWDNAKLDASAITTPVILRMIIAGQDGVGTSAGKVFYRLVSAAYADGDKNQFMPQARINRAAVYKKIIATINKLRQPLKQVCVSVINNNKIAFTEYPMSQDEGYDVRSGIMEATYKLMQSVEPMIDLYHLDRDLTLAGAILYNVGNCFAIDETYQSTSDDVLLGTGALGFEEIIRNVTLLKEKYKGKKEAELFDSDDIRMLEHIVLCNGGYIRGAFPEAIVLYQVNEMSNMVDIAMDTLVGKEKGSFVTQNAMYQRRPYRLYMRNTDENLINPGAEQSVEKTQASTNSAGNKSNKK